MTSLQGNTIHDDTKFFVSYDHYTKLWNTLGCDGFIPDEDDVLADLHDVEIELVATDVYTPRGYFAKDEVVRNGEFSDDMMELIRALQRKDYIRIFGGDDDEDDQS